jgi:hypothetical protein
VGDGDDGDPPRHQLEIAHMITHVPKRKRNIGERDTQDPGELEVNIEDMEVDNVDEVPTWATIQMVESKLIAEELSCDGPTIFRKSCDITPC